MSSRVDLGHNSVAIIGSGLVGCLLGLYLRRHGYEVSIFESRPDPRRNAEAGRSINLVLTSRGIAALTGLSDDLAQRVMAVTTPVFGRTLHSISSERAYQPYGPTAAYCNFSVSRWELNTVLLSAAGEAGCTLYFSHPLSHLDVKRGVLSFYLQDSASTQLYLKQVHARHIFAADGGGSRARQSLKAFLGESASDVALPLRYGYKELTMPAPSASAGMELKSLHIWPRGSHFMMGLANKDGSYTMTLYMPEKGPLSFESINTPEKVRNYFREYYPDAVALMPECEREFTRNPVGFLGTVLASPWIYKDKVALIGDAAHAITPFFGQGCNCGFEDVMVFDQLLSQHKNDLRRVFDEFYRARKPNADAIANMAIENFTEMMSKTADPKFLLEKAIEIELANRFPLQYVSRYALVTHSLVPYSLCKQIGEIQQEILGALSNGITKPEQADYKLAERLIHEKLVPFLNKNQITPDKYNYTSKYYPNPTAAKL
jgi:kynurenine 3-monooxygenase